MSELSKQALKVDNNQSFPNNNNGAITPSILRAFNSNMIDSTVNQTQYTDDSGSWNVQISALEAFTASAVTSAITASSLITASFNNGTRNLTFTKGDATTFNVNIPDVSGSSGDFVSTSSFNSYTASNDAKVNSLIAATGSYVTSAITASSLVTASVNLNTITFTKGDASTFNITVNTGSGGGGGTISVQDEGSILGNATSFNFTGAGVTATLSAGTASITIPGGGASSTSIITTGSITLAADNGVAIGPTNGLGTAIAGGAARLLAISGSLVLTNNAYTNTTSSLLHLSASDNTLLANFIFKANVNSGTTQISGSGNIFTNPTTPTAGYVRYVGGATNLFLNGQSQNLPQITGSAASVSGNRPTMNANYIAGPHAWIINQAPNPGTHTYSNNIIAGIGQWNFNMLGNTGVVNINNNLGLGSNMTINSPSRSIAEINAGASGSNTLQIQNNSIQGFIQYQGPVSASAHQINTNSLVGTLNLNVQSQSRAISLFGNIINGTMTMNDNTVSAPTLGSFNGIQNNNINGNFILNQRASCSINLLNNTINTWTLSNDFDASSITTATNRLLVVNGNVLFGSGNNLYASGSNEANSFTRGFNSNLFGGLAISASVVGNGGESNMISTIGVGQSLHVVGTARRNASNTTGDASTQGSAFFGRYNKEGLGFNTTAEVILAVGTGTSGSAGVVRKTGFLIDSGSNTYVEGTFNVSGSTTLSGSLYIQSASAFPSQIGTSLVTWNSATGQVGQATTATLISSSFSAGEFYSMTTLSGSSGVSASINLPNTAISNGVSIQNNSQITVQNTGVYNIQFSAQADAFDGADTIWIWFKKNGTNITDSASKLIMQNNTAAIMTVNIFDNAVPNDYFEVVWQNNAGYGKLISDASTGNIPGIPSIIVTVNQVK
jgi:hypothetical protein